ncbi:MAG: hypothetical protein FJ291_01430 [Planctomycetes bacterium]|nr:hypothetical protein [Planctomycetota bacterium]
MALIQKDRRKKVSVSEMNMTPLIDIVFQLLLFFMVGMKFKELDRKLETDLPKAGKPKPEDPLIIKNELWIKISVKAGTEADPNPKPHYVVDQKVMADAAHLRRTLAAASRLPGAKEDPVILDPRDEAHHGWIMTAMDYLREYGFKSINFKQ